MPTTDNYDDDIETADPHRVTSLCLSRKRGEGILFDGPVDRIVVNSVTRHEVKLVVFAPRSTRVLRTELIAEEVLT